MSPRPRSPAGRPGVATRRDLLLGLAGLAAGCSSGGAAPAPASSEPPLGSGSGSSRAAPGGSASAEPPPERLVVVGGPLTEIVFALGAGARVVGVDTSSQFPPDVAALPKVGYQRQLAVEPLLALAPTRIFLAEESGPPDAIAHLERAGVPLVRVPGAAGLAPALERIRVVARALEGSGATGSASRGEELASRIELDVQAASARAAERLQRPRALFLYARGAGTMFVGGRGTTAAAMLELAGASNAGEALEGFATLTAEAAAAAAPTVIVVPAKGLASLGGVEGLLRQPGLRESPAGRAKAVAAVDDLLLLGFGPRLAEAVDALSTAMAGALAAKAP